MPTPLAHPPAALRPLPVRRRPTATWGTAVVLTAAAAVAVGSRGAGAQDAPRLALRAVSASPAAAPASTPAGIPAAGVARLTVSVAAPDTVTFAALARGVPLQVRVLDAAGQAAAPTAVTWRVVAGDVAVTDAASGSDGAGVSTPKRAATRSSKRRIGHQSPTSAVAAPSAQPFRSDIARVSSAWRAASKPASVSPAPGVLGSGPTAEVSRTRYSRSRSKASLARESQARGASSEQR